MKERETEGEREGGREKEECREEGERESKRDYKSMCTSSMKNGHLLGELPTIWDPIVSCDCL